jgi:hypothetical protein
MSTFPTTAIAVTNPVNNHVILFFEWFFDDKYHDVGHRSTPRVRRILRDRRTLVRADRSSLLADVEIVRSV